MKRASIVVLSILACVAVGEASSLDKDLVRKPIRAKMEQFRACYEKALEKNPTLEGKVVVKFVIGKDGRVIESMGSGLPVVKDCVANVVKTIVFRTNKRDVITVSYPFYFAPYGR